MKKFMIFLMVSCALPAGAVTAEDLLQTNVTPDEIIRQMENPTLPSLPTKENEFIQVGTIISLIQNKENAEKYDFTIELLSDGSIITLTGDNQIDLRTGDMIKIMGEPPRIEEKI